MYYFTKKQKKSFEQIIKEGDENKIVNFLANFFLSTIQSSGEEENGLSAFAPGVQCYCKYCDEGFESSEDAIEHDCGSFNFGQALIPLSNPVIHASHSIIDLLKQKSKYKGPKLVTETVLANKEISDQILHVVESVLESFEIEREEKRDILGDFFLSLLSFTKCSSELREIIVEMLTQSRMEFLIPIKEKDGPSRGLGPFIALV